MNIYRKVVLLLLLFPGIISAQNLVKGKISDAGNGDPLIGANVVINGTTEGNITDWDGLFEFKTTQEYPLTLSFSYLGYVTKELVFNSPDDPIDISLEEESVMINVVEVKASRISDEVKKSPLTIESLDLLAIKETPSSNFYEGLGALKGVDLTTASLGFQIINTRGFNSTSPVRSLQIIDGVDNQAPGLNFSLGNFLGASELDVLKVDIVVGASSAFYGPGAFNGVVSMKTKNPFFHKGIAASIKVGERNQIKGAIRYANALKGKEGHDWFAYKFNLAAFQADDWVANNTDPVFGTNTGVNNPGGYDRVNTYGDEYNSLNDQTTANLHTDLAGLNIYHRTGYDEVDLVDYDTKNLKSNVSLYFRLNPEKEIESPELMLCSSYSNGTTVYQGDNRFSLKNIEFFQNTLELRKRDKYFIRAYVTQDNAGDSYDPYFTALLLQDQAKTNEEWRTDYINYWRSSVFPQMLESGYPQLDIGTDSNGYPLITFDSTAWEQWVEDPINQSNLATWHSEAKDIANMGVNADGTLSYLEPGTTEFQTAFDSITSRPSGDPRGGTKFIDRSSLYHLHGEYTFNPKFLDYFKVGANARLYTPESEGTVFIDSTDQIDINTFEYGVYGGFQKAIIPNKLKFSASIRMDKNENFNSVFSPAASFVWTPSEANFLRVSFSSAVRNPTLTDQYLDLNVGRAILSGNLNGVDSLITVESFTDYIEDPDKRLTNLEYFNIAAISPEKVKTFELGYRTTLFESVFADASYYYSIYNDFIGYNIGVDATFDPVVGFPTSVQAYRYSANSVNTVNTQGFSIGLNYYFSNYRVSGNYSWNNLIKTVEDDPIIPAFNTPEHKYNLGFSARNLSVGNNEGGLGFSVNYKWIKGFLFEGSPQFTGFIPSYGLVDAQISYNFNALNTTVKLGASNILDNQVYQTYGGPRIGRMGYLKITYDFKIK